MLAEILDTAGQVADEPEEHVHRGRLHVPARLPTRDGVGTQAQELSQCPLSLADIHVGDFVGVAGTENADGSVAARVVVKIGPIPP